MMQFSTLLLVDDDPAHLTLIERNLRRIGYTREIVKLTNGQSCLDWINAYRAEHGSATSSPCVFLDINMPVKNGINTLQEIKMDDDTNHIPVIMLTTSDNAEEVDQCYRAGCNAYVVKPTVHEEFKEKIRQIGLLMQNMSAPHLH